MRKFFLYLIFTSVILLVSCQSRPQPTAENKPATKPEPKPTQTYTGREAFQRVYVVARGWAPDATLYRVESQATSDAKGHDGKAAIWKAGFASPSRGSIKTYTWSESQAEGAPEAGVNPGVEDTYNPAIAPRRSLTSTSSRSTPTRRWKSPRKTAAQRFPSKSLTSQLATYSTGTATKQAYMARDLRK